MPKSKSESDANSLLQIDHETVNDLFERFGEFESSSEMAEIITAAIQELRIHRTIEESNSLNKFQDSFSDNSKV